MHQMVMMAIVWQRSILCQPNDSIFDDDEGDPPHASNHTITKQCYSYLRCFLCFVLVVVVMMPGLWAVGGCVTSAMVEATLKSYTASPSDDVYDDKEDDANYDDDKLCG